MSALHSPTRLANAAPASIAPGLELPAGVRPMPAGDHEQIFFHFDFLRSLQLHKKLATGIFAAFFLLTAYYLVKNWNTYTAQAIVYVQPAPPVVLPNGPQNRWPYDQNSYESYIQQQIHNVTRADVLMAAMQKIPGWMKSGENPQLAALRLGSAVVVARVGSGYQISITSKAKTADRAAQIANAVANSYIETAARELRAGDPQRIQLLSDERDRITKELAADRAEQEDLSKKLGVASLNSSVVDPIDQQISAVRDELVKARADNDEAAARLVTIDKGGAATSAALDAEADELVNTDPGLVSMKTSLNARRSQLITQMANLTPNNPLYKQDAEELTHINASLESMTRDLRAKAAAHIEQKLKNDLDRTSTVEARLNSQLAQLTEAAGTAAPRLQRSSELTADIQRLQTRFAAVDEEYRNLTLENDAPGAVYLSAPAVPPPGATRITVLRNAIVLILAGILLGWGAAILAHNLDPRIYIATDVERVLGFTPMAQLPDFVEVGTGVAEEYMLRLAAALEHAHQQGALKSCVFTGVASGAGATTVANHVTGMLEAMGRATVLVDASGHPAPPVLTEGSPDAGTDLVPAPKGTRSTALLQQMAEEAGEETIVLSDTAPLLVSGETEYLARFVDSAIVVIESGVTTKAQLRDAAHTLQRLDVSSVGFVLNRISMSKANPSFRDSVRAVEQHMKGSKPDRIAEEPRARAAARTKTKPSPGTDDEPAGGHDPAEVTEAAAAPNRAVSPEPVPAAEPAPPAAESRTEAPAAPKAVSDPTVSRFVDRVVGDPYGERLEPEIAEEQPSAPMRGRPLRQASPPPASAQHVEPTTQPETAEFVPSPPPASPPAPAPAAAPVAAAPEPARPVAPPAMSSANPAALNEIALRPAGPEGELPYNPATRLGGLRNLFVSLGLKSLSKEEEGSETQSVPEPPADRIIERPVYQEPLPPVTAHAAPQNAAAAAALVTATPEFLPPRPLVETTEKQTEPESSPSSVAQRPARRDSNEEIQTLPSWRGQYRKRR